MRQAGLKPKSHKSGIYWTRAASTGSAKSAKPLKEDYNGDGVIDELDEKDKHGDMIIGLTIGFVIGTILLICALISGEPPKPAWKYLI